MADHFHRKQIPFGFNPASETDDPRRADYDIYTGTPGGRQTFLEFKMDWESAFTPNLFIELKSLEQTKADHLVVGMLYLHSFRVARLRELAEERLSVPTWEEKRESWQMYRFRMVQGGDQANNYGFLLPKQLTRQGPEREGQPFWEVLRELGRPS